MSDILEELFRQHRQFQGGGFADNYGGSIYKEAAEEITRLRAELSQSQAREQELLSERKGEGVRTRRAIAEYVRTRRAIAEYVRKQPAKTDD